MGKIIVYEYYGEYDSLAEMIDCLEPYLQGEIVKLDTLPESHTLISLKGTNFCYEVKEVNADANEV